MSRFTVRGRSSKFGGRCRTTSRRKRKPTALIHSQTLSASETSVRVLHWERRKYSGRSSRNGQRRLGRIDVTEADHHGAQISRPAFHCPQSSWCWRQLAVALPPRKPTDNNGPTANSAACVGNASKRPR